ncbi:MAG: hypothetical protein ACTSXZ_02815, partial [Alphaproteobacteria bacterium]
MLAVAVQLLPLLMLAGMGYFFFQKTSTLFDATWDEVFGRMMPVVYLNDDLHRAAMPVNDYLITGDRAELASYRARAEVVDREFQALLGKWRRNGDSRQGRETVGAAQANWEAAKELARQIFALPDGGHSPRAAGLMRR